MIVGIDEVGRGAWAGPMVISGVRFDRFGCEGIEEIGLRNGVGWWVGGEIVIGDSKVLSKYRRELARDWVVSRTEYVIVEVSVEEILVMGLGNAWKEGVKTVMSRLVQLGDEVHIDGKVGVGNGLPLVGGDRRIFEIACASIVAKCYRDELMRELSSSFAVYGWEKNVGYGTPEHQAGILQMGMCVHHRRSWVEKWLSGR